MFDTNAVIFMIVGPIVTLLALLCWFTFLVRLTESERLRAVMNVLAANIGWLVFPFGTFIFGATVAHTATFAGVTFMATGLCLMWPFGIWLEGAYDRLSRVRASA